MKKIKRDDEVIVTTGKDKGKRGKVLKVQDDGRVIVSGINMIKKHTKPNPMLGTPRWHRRERSTYPGFQRGYF